MKKSKTGRDNRQKHQGRMVISFDFMETAKEGGLTLVYDKYGNFEFGCVEVVSSESVDAK